MDTSASRFRKTLLTLITFISASLGASAPVQLASADTGPLAKLGQDMYDFGSVMQGQKVVHEFAVENSGDADLVLQRIAPSCGCTAAAVSSPTIKPGGSEKIRVTFDTAGMYGAKTKTVNVVTNAREKPEFTLKLKGSVIRGISSTPERVTFGDVPQSASQAMRTKEVALNVTEGMTWDIARVTSASKFISVQELPAQGTSKRYAVTLLPDAPKGELRERLIVESKDPAQTAVNIPITATVLGDLRIIPATVSFGIVSGTELIERRLKYENASTIPVSITSVTSSHPAVSAAMLDMDGGKRGVLVIKLDPKKVTSDLKATVQVATNHPEQGTLTVSVYGVQAPK